ncbi:MAG: hypothetical protein JWR10_3900 [Rubritepida sp.]|nr:hypothetical protein [Rubritepida sp.]
MHRRRLPAAAVLFDPAPVESRRVEIRLAAQ